MKKIIIAAFAALIALGADAQNVTNSPYSQYGYGSLANQANGATIGMGGASLGWREGNQVNFSNPASYSGTDSTTFIFDAGISLQVTNFKEGMVRKNANSSSFDYVVGAFRLVKHVGVGFGIMPFSNVGYNYHNTETLGGNAGSASSTQITNSYSGSGGFHQVFVGAGVEPLHLKNSSLSVGVNLSYIWGTSTRAIINSYSDAYVNTLSKYYISEMKSYKLDLAAQFRQRLTKKDVLTVGVAYGLGHKTDSDPYCMVISNNSQTAVADTARYDADGNLSIPTSYGVGFTWNHNNQFRVSLDYSVEKWGSLKYPVYKVSGSAPSYVMADDQLLDRKKIAGGVDFVAKESSRNYFDRVHVRCGGFYSTPYVNINGQKGPKEYGATIGFGLPITNTYNNRSVLNISAQWSRLEANNLIKENTFRINLALTFNERWFAQWKLE